MATHSSVLAWRIPGTGEPGGLHRVCGVSQGRLKRLSSSRGGQHVKQIKMCHYWDLNSMVVFQLFSVAVILLIQFGLMPFYFRIGSSFLFHGFLSLIQMIFFDCRARVPLNKTNQSPLVTVLYLRVFLQRQDINKVHQLGVGWSHFNNYVGRKRLKLQLGSWGNPSYSKRLQSVT